MDATGAAWVVREGGTTNITVSAAGVPYAVNDAGTIYQGVKSDPAPAQAQPQSVAGATTGAASLPAGYVVDGKRIYTPNTIGSTT